MPRSIDVVIPVYNKEKEISACIESVLFQKGVEPHVICVDDGSTDGSAALLDAWAKKNPAVTVCHKPNGGVSAARNTGLGMLRSEWFTFCDADDVLLPGALDQLVSLSESTGCDMAAGCTEKETASGTVVYDGGAPAVYSEKKDILSLGLISQFGGCFSKIYKTERLGAFRFDEDLRINEDGLYILRVLMACNKVAVTDFPVYRYRYYPASASHDAFSPKYRDILTAGERKRELLSGSFDTDFAESFFARHLLMYLNKMASCTSGVTDAMLSEARRNVLRSAHALKPENNKERLRLFLIRYAFGLYLKIMRRNGTQGTNGTEGAKGAQAGQ